MSDERSIYQEPVGKDREELGDVTVFTGKDGSRTVYLNLDDGEKWEFYGTLSDSVQAHLDFWPTLEKYTKDLGNIYFRIKDEDFLRPCQRLEYGHPKIKWSTQPEDFKFNDPNELIKKIPVRKRELVILYLR